MESTYIVWALSFSLFCHASENPTNKSYKSLMDEYNDSFKPQLETENQQERRFGRGSSGPGEGYIVVASPINVNEKIAKLKGERAELLNKIERRAGGNSTMAYRAVLKSNQPQLNDINEKIKNLEQLKARL